MNFLTLSSRFDAVVKQRKIIKIRQIKHMESLVEGRIICYDISHDRIRRAGRNTQTTVSYVIILVIDSSRLVHRGSSLSVLEENLFVINLRSQRIITEGASKVKQRELKSAENDSRDYTAAVKLQHGIVLCYLLTAECTQPEITCMMMVQTRFLALFA